MSLLVSIIVPVYNTEAYLEDCVESIKKQTYHNIELILVDDGSTDRSGMLCDRYGEEDERVIVIHQENGGLSSARNTGIQASTGSCLYFADSDDYMDPLAIDILVQEMEGNQSEIVACKMSYNRKMGRSMSKGYRITNYTGLEAFREAMSGNNITLSSCDKLFRKEVLLGMQFPEGKLYEDAYLIPQLLYKCHRVTAVNQELYYYRYRPDSITKGNYTSQSLQLLDTYKMHLDFVKKNVPEFEMIAQFRLDWSCCFLLDKMLLSPGAVPKEDMLQVKDYIRHHWSDMIRSPYMPTQRKIRLLVLQFSSTGYKWIAQMIDAWRERWSC